ncbi:hypothetical protein PHJA_000214300 [Phtheirospermum japonicum]|uniref:Uncharacterized protein n=1 Tax=Phtheirospermum japonicum TaxID=374723 RepID=A0A830B019_9LAMI|nr:hypothetical protein PHJA_000214300 [Phtheirospermum japonicum]
MPEMEMVARALDKSLSVEQREYIMNSFITICGNDIDQSVVEALGLVESVSENCRLASKNSLFTPITSFKVPLSLIVPPLYLVEL